MRKMTILVDLDGTVAEFDEQFITWVKAHGYDFDRSTFTTFNIHDNILGLPDRKAQKKLFAYILSDVRFWEGIPVVPEAQEAMALLCQDPRFHVRICTNPWGTEQRFRDVKTRWVNQFFPYIGDKDIIFSGKDKWLIPGEVIIDDKPEVLENCMPIKFTVKPNHSYNVNTPCDYSFSRWSFVPGIIEDCWDQFTSQG